MTITIQRPSTRILTPGARGIRYAQPGGGAAWYLSGGIAAANCMAAYTPKGAASLAASYDNNAAPGNGLPDGTYDAAPGVAPTWAVGTGWTFNGTTQYLETGITPSTGWAMIMRFANASLVGNHVMAGSYLVRFFYVSQALVGTCYYGLENNERSGSPATASGVLAINNRIGYLNGIADTAQQPANAGVYQSIVVGAGRGPSVAFFYAGDILAGAIYNATLTVPQIVAVTAAMAAL